MTDPAVRTRIQVCIDCADAEALAEFWARALTYERHFIRGWQHAIDPAGVGPVVWFQPVPETKAVNLAAPGRRSAVPELGAHPAPAAGRPAGLDRCRSAAPCPPERRPGVQY